MFFYEFVHLLWNKSRIFPHKHKVLFHDLGHLLWNTSRLLNIFQWFELYHFISFTFNFTLLLNIYPSHIYSLKQFWNEIKNFVNFFQHSHTFFKYYSKRPTLFCLIIKPINIIQRLLSKFLPCRFEPNQTINYI